MTLPADQYYEAQLGVIGSLLLDAPKVAGMVMHRTQADDFTGVMKTIYQAARTLFLEGKPIDPVTIQNAVGREYGETLMQIIRHRKRRFLRQRRHRSVYGGRRRRRGERCPELLEAW